MNNRRTLFSAIVSAVAMCVIIFDSRTAIASAREGVALCINTIIPSLFPFFALSGVINSSLMGQNFPFSRSLGRMCKIPRGSESLLILGLLAGYPVGAQLITQEYRDGKLSKVCAQRMLGFCNNAGPAFFFGIISPLFFRKITVWILWAIHIFSAVLTGCILPTDAMGSVKVCDSPTLSFPESLQRGLKAMSVVCGWVIVFRIVLGFCSRWFLWRFSLVGQVLLSGLLELTNGCVLLQHIPKEGARFLLAGVMVSFGGLCVSMQTISATEALGIGWYFPGKVLQTTLTAAFCLLLQPIIFDEAEAVICPLPAWVIFLCFLLLLLFALRRKKVVAFPDRLLYNTGNE